MSDNLTSVSLLERLRDRSDEDAWHRFHDLYGPLIRGWLMRRGVRQQDADDVGQDVMSLAVTELPGFQHNGRVGALRAWLRQVVACLSSWRSRVLSDASQAEQATRASRRGGIDNPRYRVQTRGTIVPNL